MTNKNIPNHVKYAIRLLDLNTPLTSAAIDKILSPLGELGYKVKCCTSFDKSINGQLLYYLEVDGERYILVDKTVYNVAPNYRLAAFPEDSLYSYVYPKDAAETKGIEDFLKRLVEKKYYYDVELNEMLYDFHNLGHDIRCLISCNAGDGLEHIIYLFIDSDLYLFTFGDTVVKLHDPSIEDIYNFDLSGKERNCMEYYMHKEYIKFDTVDI